MVQCSHHCFWWSIFISIWYALFLLRSIHWRCDFLRSLHKNLTNQNKPTRSYIKLVKGFGRADSSIKWFCERFKRRTKWGNCSLPFSNMQLIHCMSNYDNMKCACSTDTNPLPRNPIWKDRFQLSFSLASQSSFCTKSQFIATDYKFNFAFTFTFLSLRPMKKRSGDEFHSIVINYWWKENRLNGLLHIE